MGPLERNRLDGAVLPTHAFSTMVSVASGLSAATMFRPLAAMSDFVPVEHPKLSVLQKRADTTIAALHKIAELRVELGQWSDGEVAEAEATESWRIGLANLRILGTELETGLATRRFARELRRHLKPTAVKFDDALALAIENVRQLRAFSAVMCGEHDDEELGIEVIPPPSSSPSRGPSVRFDW